MDTHTHSLSSWGCRAESDCFTPLRFVVDDLLPVFYAKAWPVATRLIHRSGVPTLGLTFSVSLVQRSCCWIQFLFILITCPSHWSPRCFSCPSMGTSFALRKMVSFSISSQLVTLRMSRRHFMSNVLSFLKSFCVMVQVSAPYNSMDMAIVWHNLILVALLRFALQNTF